MNVLRPVSVTKPGLFDKKRSRIIRRALSFESLEGRTLLAATSSGLGIGINLSNIAYNSAQYMWANVMEQAQDQWSVAQVTASGLSAVNPPTGVVMPALDSNGYPIGLGGLAAQGYALYTYVFTNIGVPYPTGTYTLTFDGAGTVEICNGTQSPQIFSQSGGLGSPVNVNIVNASSGITIAITNSNPTDYVQNIRLVLPGLQNTYQTNPFNPQFLNAIASFSTIRFISAMLPDYGSATTSDGQSGPLTWAERTPTTYFTQAAPAGMSVEYMVQLSNILHENMWVTMPVNGDSKYVTNFAQYVEQNLDPGLKVYVELGDELWNYGFPYGYSYVNSYATANNESFEDATADLTANCWNLWRAVFAGQTNRMVRVAASFLDEPWLLTQELDRLIATSSPTDPDHGFDIVSGAAYFAPTTSTFNASTTVSQIESATMAEINGTFQQELQGFMATVASFEAQLGRSIPVDMYEGGDSLTDLSGPSWWSAYAALQTDPGMDAVNTTWLDDLTEAGVAGINYICVGTPVSAYGEWGAMDYVGEPSNLTPKYNALVDFTSFGISGPSTPVAAGTPFQFTVTVYEPNGSTIDTGYSGTVQLQSSDPLAVLPATYAFTPADHGVHTFTVTLKTAGTPSISATSSTDGAVTQADFTVQPALPQSLVISGVLAIVPVGVTDTVSINVCDPYGNTVTGYTGTVQLTCSDLSAGLPSMYTFTSADAGAHSFPVVFKALGILTITAADTTKPSLAGSATATVKPLVATRDTTTQGNWIGTYGTQGYDLLTAYSSLPSYATVTVSGAHLTTWASNNTDPRALQTVTSTGRVASAEYSATSFTVDVNLTDGQWHNLELYLLDWGRSGWVEQVQVTNAATGAVLDTETVSSFGGGMYLNWTVSGNILITITPQAGSSYAVFTGLFLDSASLVGKDTTTQGNWIGAYGSDGYNVIGNSASYPAYATVNNSGQTNYTWTTASTSPSALEDAVGSSRIAACWYSSTSFLIDVNITDGQTHDLALYALDYNGSNQRSEQIQITDATTGAVLDTETISSFSSGVYLQWAISGNVTIKVSRLAGANAVISGLFFDPPAQAAASTASAMLLKRDTATEGNWIGAYGSQGYNVIGNSANYPAYATVSASGQTNYTWTTISTSPTALEDAVGSSRIAACWYSPTSFSINVNFTDGQTHDLALYALDYNGSNQRSEQIQISSATTGAVLDTETISSFTGGVYLRWAISGSVVIKVTRVGGANAVLSGLFLDPA